MSSLGYKNFYQMLPAWLQDNAISLYGMSLAYHRHRSAYFKWKRFYKESHAWSRDRLESYQVERLRAFLGYVMQQSSFYRSSLRGLSISEIRDISSLAHLPLLRKEEVRIRSKEIVTASHGVRVHTGGTTGTPLEVFFESEDLQERHARLAIFRELHGAHHRMRRATFSGRIISPHLDDKRTWRYNFILNQRLYSSFHLNEKSLSSWIVDLNRFKPEWMDGFPSTMFVLAKYILDNGIKLDFSPRVIFSTSETLYDWQRETFWNAFGAKARNQYASAEGAPFITECPHGRLHMDLRTGIFENSSEGLVVTSFSTRGFPLIRYLIGDRVVFSDPGAICDCGDNNPLVESIFGRDQDSILSKERGPIFVGLVDIFKNVPSVVKNSQIIQTAMDKVELRLVVDSRHFNAEHREALVHGLRERLGDGMEIEIKIVDKIDRDKSGKYRFIKREFTIPS